jgi:hypothetical protein
MVADPLDTARQDVFEGRRRLASQEQLIDDLLRTDCTSLLPIAKRLLRHTRKQQHARERHFQNLAIATDVPILMHSPAPVETVAGSAAPRSTDRPAPPRLLTLA